MNSSPTDSNPLDDAIETAAAEWLIEREDGFTPGRAAQFAAWRAADSRHDFHGESGGSFGSWLFERHS